MTEHYKTALENQPVSSSVEESHIVLDSRDLRTYYFTRFQVIRAVDNVSFALTEGDALGLVGESGSGKSTLGLSIIRRIVPPGRIVDGQVLFQDQDLLSLSEGEMRRIRWKEISMVFQSAMNTLNPMFTIEDQIMEAIRLHEKVQPQEARERVGGLLSSVGLDPARAGSYPHEFSGGMRQRAMIAMALACNPSLVLLDEPTTALDVIVQAQVLRLVKSLQEQLNLTTILITHNLSIIAEVCNKTAVMYAGQVVEYGPTEAIFRAPLHPYAHALLECSPRLNGPPTMPGSIPGNPPDLGAPPPGCRFHPRCRFAEEVCWKEEPEYREVRPGHLAACHFSDSLDLRGT